MRLFLSVFIGLVGGFLLGIALSSMIGIIGMWFIGQPIGIKYLPYFTAILCAIVVPALDQKR
ncbi:hypothetical protein GCM10010978_21840 [Compostibacillus humi]|uniref:Uncharacterized protein n=1 Tax=Compostibacillus humi TaxID=1245525 RepID=A0A8J2TTG1_9BACI|nr:DUF5957 family protein [Compostibacillus humi]GFZ80387.1 hypothetical protein GCM10010978_21840 [Compostibacillus humi]